MNMKLNEVGVVQNNFNNYEFYLSGYLSEETVLPLKSVLNISSEYFLATSILTITIFFMLLPKLPFQYRNNTKLQIFSFINYQLNFLAILVLFFYCFICVKQYFLFLFEIPTFNNSIFNDFTSLSAKLIIGFSSIIYLLFVQNYLINQKLNYFEYYILILTSILGFCLLCCSNDLLTAYLAIELQGLSFYLLSSFKKNSNYSVESGVKYFIIGSFSTIIFLLGVNLIYGVSGSISIFDFKDLFVWVFSLNSFFLSFDNLTKGLEFFQLEKSFSTNQEHKSFEDDFFLISLKTIFNNFLILKNKVSISLSDSFYFINEITQEDVCFEENLIENISVQMLDKKNKMNDSLTVSVLDKESIFQLLFSEPRELIIANMFQNLIAWFLLDSQNCQTEFKDYDSFSESLLTMDSEFELLNKFKYNLIHVEGFHNFISELFGPFENILNNGSFINDWSEYLAFRHLSETLDMTLTIDIFSDHTKTGSSKIFNNNAISCDCDSNKFLLILKKFSTFGYISLDDSKFIMNNINKLFKGISASSDLNLIFSSLEGFQDYKDLCMFKCLLFSSVSKDEYTFYRNLSNLIVDSSNPEPALSNSLGSNNSFTDGSTKDILFSSRVKRFFTSSVLIENEEFMHNYFLTFNKINSNFITVSSQSNYLKDMFRVIECYLDNNLNHYGKRIIPLLCDLHRYYLNNSVELELDDLYKVSPTSQINFDDYFRLFLQLYDDKITQNSEEMYESLFSLDTNDFIHHYDCSEFFSLLSKYIPDNDGKETSETFFWHFSYYLIYCDFHSRNVDLLYYLFDIMTKLFNFIEPEDFFADSSSNKQIIVSDYETSLTAHESLTDIVKRFELLQEKSTLSIVETRILISEIMKILKCNCSNHDTMELLANLAFTMENNFPQDNEGIFLPRANELKITKVFPFILREMEDLVKEVNETILKFSYGNTDVDSSKFLLDNCMNYILTIQRLFSSNFAFFLPYQILESLDPDCGFSFMPQLEKNSFNFMPQLEKNSESSKINNTVKLEYLKILAIVAHNILFYTEPSTSSDGSVILPKDLSYLQRIDFLDFLIFKIKLLKGNFIPTRWEFEFLLKEVNLNNFKDKVLREKYHKLFKSLRSMISSYISNSHRAVESDISDNPKKYENIYDARQTTWFFESVLINLSAKSLIRESEENCVILAEVLAETFYNETISIPLNLPPIFVKDIKMFCRAHRDLAADNYVFLVKILHLFPLFLDCFENPSVSTSFVFDTFLIELGLLLILISLFLKLSLTPFHLWSPDIYEGSPSSTTFFFVVISKISIFVFLLKICYLSFYSMIIHWQFYSLLVAILSILLGSIAALKQRKIKSLLAYSSISNMGLILASFSTGNFEGIKAVFYYFIIYIISGLSIWLIFLGLKLKKKKVTEKYNKDLGDFSLLYESNSALAYSFVITIFTIAGIPPMTGFLAKISIFLSLIFSSMFFISFMIICVSVISTFYYIRILKIIFFENLIVGKLFYPINSKINIISSFLFFLMIFLFINPLCLDLFTYKIVLFLSKSFY